MHDAKQAGAYCVRRRVVGDRANEHLGSSRLGAGGRFCSGVAGLAHLRPGCFYAAGQHHVLLAAVSDAGVEALARATPSVVLVGLRAGALVDRSLYVQISLSVSFSFFFCGFGSTVRGKMCHVPLALLHSCSYKNNCMLLR